MAASLPSLLKSAATSVEGVSKSSLLHSAFRTLVRRTAEGIGKDLKKV